MSRHELSGDALLKVMNALASPHRLRIVAQLQRDGRHYVSELARAVGLSRPLVHLHLQKLLEAGLVVSELELSTDGKALNYFAVAPFALALNPSLIAQAVQTLSTPSD